MNKFKVVWTKIAFNDLDDIIEYIKVRDSLTSAKKVFNKIRNAALDLELLPLRGRIVPELALHNITGYRELIIPPWRIFYRIDKDLVYVMAVLDGRRNIDDILLARILKE